MDIQSLQNAASVTPTNKNVNTPLQQASKEATNTLRVDQFLQSANQRTEAKKELLDVQSLMLDLFGVVNEDGNVEMGSLAEASEQANERISAKLKTYFRMNGIDPNTEVEFKFNPHTNHYEVQGDHPDKDKINAILKNDKELSQEITKQSVRTQLIEIGKIVNQWQQALEDGMDELAASNLFFPMVEQIKAADSFIYKDQQFAAEATGKADSLLQNLV